MIAIRTSNAIALMTAVSLLYLNLRTGRYGEFDWTLTVGVKERTEKAAQLAQNQTKELAPQLVESVCGKTLPVTELQIAALPKDANASQLQELLGPACEVAPGILRWARVKQPDLEVTVSGAGQ